MQLIYLLEMLNTIRQTKPVRRVLLNQSLIVEREPITLTDLQVYASLNTLSFEPWEIDVLLAADAALLSQYNIEEHRQR